MTTRAITYLNQKGFEFDVVEYEHNEKGAEYAARAIRSPLAKTVKTLVVDLGRKKYAFALVPGDKQLSLKQIARVYGVKRAAMADTATAERLTGYFVGGISPFGARRRLPVVMEETLLTFEDVLINAGQRGVMLIMAPGDIAKILNCHVSEIVRK